MMLLLPQLLGIAASSAIVGFPKFIESDLESVHQKRYEKGGKKN
jgi:hypothetical protein